MNEEISTNGIYNEIYNKNLFSLQKELAVEEQKHLSRRNEEEKKKFEELFRTLYKDVQKKSLDNYYSIENMNEYNKDFSLFYEGLRGKTNCLNSFVNMFNDKYPMVIRSFAKTLDNQNKDILLSIAQTYAKLVNTQEIILNDNVNLKEKTEFNLKQLDEIKNKVVKENENLGEIKKNISELKIDNHNKKMKQKSKVVECDPIIKMYQKNRKPNVDHKSMTPNNSERRITFQSDEFNKNCECKCTIV